MSWIQRRHRKNTNLPPNPVSLDCLEEEYLFNKTQNSWHGKNLVSVSPCVNFHSDKLRAPKKPTAKKIALTSESAVPGAVREAPAAADKIDDLQLRMFCNSELLPSLNDKLQFVLSRISPPAYCRHADLDPQNYPSARSMRDCRAKDEQIENPNKQLSCSTQSGMGVGNRREIHNKNDHCLLTTLRQYACQNETNPTI